MALIAAHKGDNRLVILDLRKKLDFDTAHVEGARHVPYEAGEFEKRIQGFDRESTYLVYCKRGRKVERASRLMKKLRFRRVYILRGGMTRWIDEGRDLVW